MVAIYELAAYVGEKGVASTIGMNLGGTVQLEDVAATMVEAKHSAAAQDEHGTHYVGVATGFVLSITDGPVLYHAGDTTVFGDMKLIAELYHPEVAMLPIGGHYTMGPRGGCTGHAPALAEDGSPDSLRHLPAAEGHAGGIGRAGRQERRGCAMESRANYLMKSS